MRRVSMKDVAVAVSDLMLPRLCVVCRRTLELDERHLCLDCLCQLPLTHFWEYRCNPMADKYNARIRGHLPHGVQEDYGYCAALFFYSAESPFSHIPQDLKYRSAVREGRYFSHILGQYLRGSSFFRTVDAVMPVPLHWRRKMKRGYNQSEVIAREVASVLGVPCLTSVLKRTVFSGSQTGMSMTQKASNVVDAFSVSMPPAGLHHILIIDDTFTTGSTLASCHKALRACLPSSVRISVATLSYVSI